MIDLHTHSSASDGTLSPRALMVSARQAGLRMVALTDHDTLAGVAPAAAAAVELGQGFVPGVEISVDHIPGTMHIVGLGVESGHQGLLNKLENMAGSRHERILEIIRKLQDMGLQIDYEELSGTVDGVVGRPHVAKLMIRKGYALDINDAFNR